MKQSKSQLGFKVLNLLLMFCFLITILVPITGIHLHKLASTLFLILSIIHTILYHKALGLKKYLLVAIIVLSFISGLSGMIFDQYPIILQLHKVISIASIFFLAIHIFIYRKKLLPHQ